VHRMSAYWSRKGQRSWRMLLMLMIMRKEWYTPVGREEPGRKQAKERKGPIE